MSLEYRIGDVFDRLAEIPDGSIDLIVTSPPFLALRDYLPADHPDKAKEIGNEPTPGEFIDTLLALSAEWGRVLAPHGSLCVELGDTYSDKNGRGWPLAKSLTGIPTIYPWSLAYGRNLLTGEDSPAGQWRIRNMIVWARPNPPVGQLADKFRPATSYITVACRGAARYFDLDAVRTENGRVDEARGGYRMVSGEPCHDAGRRALNPAGAPPLDWHADHHPEDGDWLWKMTTQPYRGSHYATFPLALPKRMIEAMCPQRVCVECGAPSERITDRDGAQVGWTDCGHDQYRTGVVLDPFAGSGTTLDAAQAVGRHAIGIDLDERNADLARERVGMFMEVTP